jgi:hypothetical protein
MLSLTCPNPAYPKTMVAFTFLHHLSWYSEVVVLETPQGRWQISFVCLLVTSYHRFQCPVGSHTQPTKTIPKATERTTRIPVTIPRHLQRVKKNRSSSLIPYRSGKKVGLDFSELLGARRRTRHGELTSTFYTFASLTAAQFLPEHH